MLKITSRSWKNTTLTKQRLSGKNSQNLFPSKRKIAPWKSIIIFHHGRVANEFQLLAIKVGNCLRVNRVTPRKLNFFLIKLPEGRQRPIGDSCLGEFARMKPSTHNTKHKRWPINGRLQVQIPIEDHHKISDCVPRGSVKVFLYLYYHHQHSQVSQTRSTLEFKCKQGVSFDWDPFLSHSFLWLINRWVYKLAAKLNPPKNFSSDSSKPSATSNYPSVWKRILIFQVALLMRRQLLLTISLSKE